MTQEKGRDEEPTTNKLKRAVLPVSSWGMNDDTTGAWRTETGGWRTETGGPSGGGGTQLPPALLSHSTVDHASLSRRSTVPTHNGNTSTNSGALITHYVVSMYYIEKLRYYSGP